MATKKAAVTAVEPPYEKIKARAYELYAEDGYEHGRDVEHWLRAEAELITTIDQKPVKSSRAKKKR